MLVVGCWLQFHFPCHLQQVTAYKQFIGGLIGEWTSNGYTSGNNRILHFDYAYFELKNRAAISHKLLLMFQLKMASPALGLEVVIGYRGRQVSG